MNKEEKSEITLDQEFSFHIFQEEWILLVSMLTKYEFY